MSAKNAGPNSLVSRAWARDGKITITGQALLLACLLHTHGAGRNSEDFKDVQKIMGDINLDPDHKPE